MRPSFLLALLLLVAPLARAAEPERPPLLVLDVEGKGVGVPEAQAVGLGVVRGLRALDVFQVLTSDDVRQLLALERGRQLLGDNTEGTRRVAQALGTRHVVAGSLSRVAGQLQVELRLLDSEEGKVLAQKTLGPAPSLETLAGGLPDVAQALVAPLLQAQQGSLLVRAREEGAEVLVDDVLVASTPMPGAVPVSRGAHRVVVRKDGFIAQARTVRIQPEQVAVEEVVLLPSADYAQAWARRHGTLRLGAWVASGVAVASLVGAVAVDRLAAEPTFRTGFLPRQLTLTSASAEDVAAAGLSAEGERVRLACGEDVSRCRSEARALREQLQVQQVATWSLAGLGAVATGTAFWLWMTGEDPNRYAGLVAGVAPTPGGAGVAVSGRF